MRALGGHLGSLERLCAAMNTATTSPDDAGKAALMAMRRTGSKPVRLSWRRAGIHLTLTTPPLSDVSAFGRPACSVRGCGAGLGSV